MEFKLVLEKLLTAFKKERVRGEKKMKMSKEAEKELVELAKSGSLRKDMELLRS